MRLPWRNLTSFTNDEATRCQRETSRGGMRWLLPHVGQPALVLRIVAPGCGEERLLELLGDGAPAVGADGSVIDLPDRNHLGGGARIERLVRRVQVEPREVPLDDRVTEIPRYHDDRVSGDAIQASRGERRRVQGAVLHHEDVLPWTVGDVAGHVEHDPL